MAAVKDTVQGLHSRRSILSIRSEGSILSIGSAYSVLSIGSVGSVLSIGSVGSFGSIISSGSFASLGSAFSAMSRWSLFSWHGDRVALSNGGKAVGTAELVDMEGRPALRVVPDEPGLRQDPTSHCQT
ncbi:hypothetical protein HLB23_08235 [Nocardia uniformis]|uniref:Uncharacterized protein n=1 Tax=Nocardia uniformis TaxID=53432 RepID=A0A849BTD3_9NOCA|nr:hypothetical protein [Nocardia uniformis]NNH69853.1 hypothetical protein [Nocardia uniformis]